MVSGAHLPARRTAAVMCEPRRTVTCRVILTWLLLQYIES